MFDDIFFKEYFNEQKVFIYGFNNESKKTTVKINYSKTIHCDPNIIVFVEDPIKIPACYSYEDYINGSYLEVLIYDKDSFCICVDIFLCDDSLIFVTEKMYYQEYYIPGFVGPGNYLISITEEIDHFSLKDPSRIFLAEIFSTESLNIKFH